MLPEDVPDVTRDWLLEVERTNLNPVPELKQTSLDKVVKVLTNRKAGNPTNTGKTEKIKKTAFKFNKKLKQKESDEIQRTSKNIFNWFSKGSLTQPIPPQNNIQPAEMGGRGGKYGESVVGVVRQLVDPHHHRMCAHR